MNSLITIPANTNFERLIVESWSNTRDGILETCRLIAKAKAMLQASEFSGMKLPFTRQTINRLVEIGKDQRIYDNKELMPSSWGTLYALSRLSDKEWSKAIKEKRICSKITRSQATNLKGKNPKPTNSALSNKVKVLSIYATASKADEILSLLDGMEELHQDDVHLETAPSLRSIEEDKKKAVEIALKKTVSKSFNLIKDHSKKLLAKKRSIRLRNQIKQSNGEIFEFLEQNTIRGLQADTEAEAKINYALNSLGEKLTFNELLKEFI
jgi:hypothetical protein